MEPPLSQAEVREALRAEMHHTLYPITFALIPLYALYAVAHPFVVGGYDGQVLTLAAGLTAVVFAGIVWRLKRIEPEARAVNGYVLLVAALVSFNSVLHFVLLRDPLQTTNLLLVLIAAGYLLLWTSAYVGLVLCIAGIWGVVALEAAPSPVWTHFAFAVGTAVLLGFLIHFVRRDNALHRYRLLRREAQLRRALEVALDEQQVAYEQVQAHADQKAYTLDVISHEVRTPLTGIIGFADLLERETGGQQATFAQLIGRSARRLHETLNAFLDLSRLDAGSVEQHRVRLDAGAAVADLLAPLYAEAAAKGLDLVLSRPNTPLYVRVDPVFLDRIVTNLVANALKFTDTGQVVVRLAGEADAVRLYVVDTGPGIDPAFLPHVFEPFRQASGTLGRVHHGSGLGLAIVARLVALLDGTVAVQNEPGGGACFTVTLPRA